MRQLLPDPVDVGDVVEFESTLVRPPPAGRPWVLCNMIASVDGAVEVEGRSGPLGGPADRQVFRALRSLADVILVGAGTVRHERYRAPQVADEVRARRVARGQRPRPRLALVTAGLDVDPGLEMFDDPDNAPYLVIPASAPAPNRQRFDGRAQVIESGDQRVDLGTALRLLHDDGAQTVLVEGGPSINGQLLADDLVDEWRLTVSPLLVAGEASRAAVGPPRVPLSRFRLDRVLVHEDLLFLRHLRR